MKFVKAIAQHFYEVHYGDSWTDVAMKDVLKGIAWKQAVEKVGDLNTIAVLVHHIDFYNMVVYERLSGGKKQFNHEDSLIISINNDREWKRLQKTYFVNADKLHGYILTIKDEELFKKRPGNVNTNYKNLHGVIEHIHYHLGQISLLKKLLAGEKKL